MSFQKHTKHAPVGSSAKSGVRSGPTAATPRPPRKIAGKIGKAVGPA